MSTYEIAATILLFIIRAVDIYTIGMIIYFFMSWVPGLRESVIGEWMGKIYEPFLTPFRNMIPPLGMFDISSIAALIFLNFFKYGLIAIYNNVLPNLI